MRYITYSLIAIVIIAAGWFLWHPSETHYAAAVADETEALEAELAALQVAVENDALTPEAAAEAATRITARINTIQSSVASASPSTLTDAQAAQLASGLTHLKSILVTYQSTLEKIDATAELVAKATTTTRDIKYTARKHLSAVLAGVVAAVEAHADDVIADYTPEDTLPDDVTADEFEEIYENSATATSTESVSDDTEGTDEVIDSNDTATSTDSMKSSDDILVEDSAHTDTNDTGGEDVVDSSSTTETEEGN